MTSEVSSSSVNPSDLMVKDLCEDVELIEDKQTASVSNSSSSNSSSPKTRKGYARVKKMYKFAGKAKLTFIQIL